MPKIEFFVQNHTEAATNRRVLVFLRPAGPTEGLLFHAWQTLSPPPRGGSQAFTLEGRLAVTAAEDTSQGSRSARWSIAPGQTLAARLRNGQGPELGLSSEEAGGLPRVLNQSGAPLRITWYCDGRAILRQTVDRGSSAELQLSPVLLFQILEPSRNGLYRPGDVLRSPIEYRVPDKTRLVDAIWMRSADGDALVFDPPPAPPETSPAAEAAPQPQAEAQATPRKRKS